MNESGKDRQTMCLLGAKVEKNLCFSQTPTGPYNYPLFMERHKNGLSLTLKQHMGGDLGECVSYMWPRM